MDSKRGCARKLNRNCKQHGWSSSADGGAYSLTTPLPLTDENAKKAIYNRWMDEWLTDNLTAEQKSRPRSKQTSIFNVYLKRVYGGKYFLMALLESSIVWTPSLEQMQLHARGAVEHVARRFCAWLQAVLEAIRKHKNYAETIEARRRSGDTWGQHGLTAQEVADRRERDMARRDLHLTLQLQKQLQAGKTGSGRKGQKGRRGNGGAPEHIQPRTWWELTEDEQWWLSELWAGRLHRRVKDAEAKMHPVQACSRKMEFIALSSK